VRKSTNTGRLAALCLVNSEIVVRGDGARPVEPFAFDPETRPLFLFPHPGARPLSREDGADRPVTLIVPDGTWRQASKVHKRVPGLAELPCVSLSNEGPSGYRLRRWPHEEGLSTLEAVARALGVLEGEAVRRELERVLRVAVERTLWARGRLDASEVTGGIPEAARRHAGTDEAAQGRPGG
jgi:DTW domain-containing protein